MIFGWDDIVWGAERFTWYGHNNSLVNEPKGMQCRQNFAAKN